MRGKLLILGLVVVSVTLGGCFDGIVKEGNTQLANGEWLLGNNDYKAMSYSGDREWPRSQANSPSVKMIKEDMKLLSAMGVKLIRTYNSNEFPQARNLLQAITELKQDDPEFEMYVMVGAWIQCYGAFKDDVPTDHDREDYQWNKDEIEEAIKQAKEYPDIVKIIAVGNEAMVDWQAHFVRHGVILKWVNRLRQARDNGEMPSNVLITSSDNWAPWGGEEKYHNDDLLALLRAVDFVSVHTYSYHDTFYDKTLKWDIGKDEPGLSVLEQSKKAMANCMEQEKKHYNLVQDYMDANKIKKQMHIGETGWSTLDNGSFGDDGNCTSDEYKDKLFHDAMRGWTEAEHLSCFYFEAFDEPWKSNGTDGSEGHFGLFTVDGKAKYPIWDLVDAGAFDGLSRGGRPITKTYSGVEAALLKDVKAPTRK